MNITDVDGNPVNVAEFTALYIRGDSVTGEYANGGITVLKTGTRAQCEFHLQQILDYMKSNPAEGLPQDEEIEFDPIEVEFIDKCLEYVAIADTQRMRRESVKETARSLLQIADDEGLSFQHYSLSEAVRMVFVAMTVGKLCLPIDDNLFPCDDEEILPWS